MNEPKVLVAAPVYSGKEYIFDAWYKNITSLDYPNYDWLVVDNSRMESFHRKLRRKGYQKIVHVPRGGNSRLGIARASEYIRNYAINNGFDYIMFIETDLIPPKNIIKRLMNHKKLIVGAVYEIGLHGSKTAPRHPLLYEAVKREDGIRLEILPPERGYPLLNTGLIQTPAMGLGCTLVHSSLFKKYTFKWTSVGKQHTDSLFYGDLWNDKVPVWCDTDILIPHFNQNWANVKDW